MTRTVDNFFGEESLGRKIKWLKLWTMFWVRESKGTKSND